MVRIEDQADLLRQDVGTDRERVAVGIEDEEGFSQVVALAHPSNAEVICKSVNSHKVMLDVLAANLSAWEDEEESVKEEHAELIEVTRALLEKLTCPLSPGSSAKSN